MTPAQNSAKAGWRIPEWCANTGISRSMAYLLMGSGAVQSVKSGRSRIIVTSPTDYLSSLSDTQPIGGQSRFEGGALPIVEAAPEINPYYGSTEIDGGEGAEDGGEAEG
jgi:hypothetical protein